MKITPKFARSAGSRDAEGGRWLLRLLAAAALVLVLMLPGALLIAPDAVQTATRKLEQRWGYLFAQADASLFEKWSIALGVYLREAKDGIPEVPQLVIDVPFKEMRKIYRKREEALERGILIQGDNDFVKGEMRFADRVVPVKLRLKGDWNDHLAGRKWSFRVRVRDGQQLLGMRRFSLQSPATRGFQAELLFFDLLQQVGVMTPRYQFVNVVVNGEALGLMALEEFFAKELLEHNRRRAGVIVRFDESLVWSARDSITGEPVGWGGAFDSYLNAPVDGIGSAAIAADPALRDQYRVAEGLLRGFAEGALRPSDAFDARQLGSYIAVADALGSWHAVAWHNLRFYLNPLSLKLEPIAFDATLQERFTDQSSVMNDEPVVAAMLRDPAVWQVYVQVLEQLARQLQDGTLQKRLAAVESRHLPLLQTEFRMLGNFPVDYLEPRMEGLLAAARMATRDGGDDHLYVFERNEPQQYPVLAHVGLLRDGVAPQLQIDSAIPKAVDVLAVEWVDPASSLRAPALAAAPLPLRLNARGVGAPPERHRLALQPPPVAAAELRVTAGIAGRNWSQVYTARPVHAALQSPPLPAASVSRLEAIAGLDVDADLQTVRIRAGDWAVDELLVLPAGWALEAGGGARLRFAADAGVVVYGPVTLLGTAADPIELVAQGAEPWLGLVVMNAASLSRLAHVRISSTRSFSAGAWSLTGGTTFYQSDVEIVSSQFDGSRGEDALNIVNARFILDDVTVAESVSDAFDADFSTGSMRGGRFTDIGTAGGGDAIDISGSEVDVSGTVFVGIADKALSVGERSTLAATGLEMSDVGTGAAAKDGSRLELSATRISNATFAGLTAYIKKPEYGPAEITARDVTITATETPVVAQTGSRIELDGVLVATRDVDVALLYDTLMKPGLRR
ncbi:MAG: CotH kinase family protein [Gammaproteobacteria bacterium]|jgi:hypothetical protein|nr:CotH kinase family protein [Gammaproteobacteria bacterium]